MDSQISNVTPYEQASRWLDKQPGAISGSGGHKQTISVACCLMHGFDLSASETAEMMHDYNMTCNPPWSESEIAHKVSDAEKLLPSKPRGYMLTGKTNLTQRDRREGAAGHPSAARNKNNPIRNVRREIPDGPISPLPEPIKDGARVLLREVFRPGEFIRIAHAVLNDDQREIPGDAGVVLSREEWMRKLDKGNGNPNTIFSNSKNTGIYIGINPMKPGGTKDADVADFRHALIEFDNKPREEQWRLYERSELPCAAIISSGGKSIHAWVKLEARDRSEYNERLAALYGYFADSGHECDQKNRNPSRFSRLPNCVRLKSRQELLAVNIGCESFTQWLTKIESEGIGKEKTMDYLLDYKVEEDPNALIGSRWLCKGGSCLIIGPSGFGKSSLEMQMACYWGIGKAFCGMTPIKPLKSLIIQAENDDGDLSESAQGVYASLGKDMLPDAEKALFRRNTVVETVSSHTGPEFITAVRRLVDKHRPDLCWLDPFAAFAGDDIGKQTTIAQFCRNGLNPIAHATGVVWMVVNHIPKPSNDPKVKARQDQYSGAGSYDLPGWARAVMVLRCSDEYAKAFELRLTKRGKRAGATHPSGQPTEVLHLRHATDGVYWLHCDPPAEPIFDPEKRKPGRPAKPPFDCAVFLGSITGETFTYVSLIKRGCDFGEIKKSKFTADVLPELKKLGLKNNEGKWSKQ